MNARWNEHAERWVLGAVMMDPGCLARVRTSLNPDDFYSSAHAEIYRALCAAWDEHKAVDIPLVHAQLKAVGKLHAAGGVQYLGGLTDEVVHTASVERHAKVVLDHARCRRVRAAGAEVAAKALDPEMSADAVVEHALRTITKAAETKNTYIQTSLDVAMELGEELNGSPDQDSKVSFGLNVFKRADLDMESGELVIVAARPGMGKSALAAQAAMNVALTCGPVGYWSLEMKTKNILKRLVRIHSGVSTHMKHFSQFERQRFMASLQTLSALNIFWDQTAGLTAAEICNRARAVHARNPLKLVVIDHLAIVSDPPGYKQGKVLAVGEATRAFRALGKELGFPVLLLHQLNRNVEGRTDKRPTLSDLRDSGSVEQDADKVVMLYRDAYYNQKMKSQLEEVEAIVVKHREGSVGTLKLNFVPNLTKFVDAEEDFAPPSNGSYYTGTDN